MIKYIFTLIFLFTLTISAQETIYFDTNWEETTREKASYYRPTPEKKKKGVWVVDYYISGKKLQEVFYVNGKPNGKFSMFFNSGELKKTGKYENGKKQGVWKTFYKTGKIKERGKYKDGNKVGIWKIFYKNN